MEIKIDMNILNIRILIVGGNGFIGSSIVQRAVDLGWDVVSLSRTEVLKKIPRVKYIVCDITDRDFLYNNIKNTKFDYVVNCSGYIDHSFFFDGGEQVFNAHLLGVINLISALNRDSLKGFINIGSSDEYGANKAPQAESSRENPISPYSFAKVCAAHFLQMLYRTDGFPAVTLRLFLVYGPGQNQERFLPQIITGCLQNQTFPVSKGEQLRDFCYISDVVDAVFLALKNTNSVGEVINIASGKAISIKDIIERVKSLCKGGRPEYGKISYRKNENIELYADVDKAVSLLAWKPKVLIDEGLQLTVKYYREMT